MTDTPSGPCGHAHLQGSLRSADGTGIVHIEDRFEASVEVVWSALVDPERLARWLGTFEGDLRSGGSFQARFFASEWEGSGRVEVCEPLQRLQVSTTEAGTTDRHVIEVRLRAEGEQTVFVIEERGIPREQLAAYGAGTQVHVEDLGAHLVGGERCDAPARWSELLPTYAAKSIDPEAVEGRR